MIIRGITFLALVSSSNFALASGAFIAEGSTINLLPIQAAIPIVLQYQ